MKPLLDRIVYRYFRNEYALLSMVLLTDFIFTATGSFSISIAIRTKVQERQLAAQNANVKADVTD